MKFDKSLLNKWISKEEKETFLQICRDKHDTSNDFHRFDIDLNLLF